MGWNDILVVMRAIVVAYSRGGTPYRDGDEVENAFVHDGSLEQAFLAQLPNESNGCQHASL